MYVCLRLNTQTHILRVYVCMLKSRVPDARVGNTVGRFAAALLQIPGT